MCLAGFPFCLLSFSSFHVPPSVPINSGLFLILIQLDMAPYIYRSRWFGAVEFDCQVLFSCCQLSISPAESADLPAQTKPTLWWVFKILAVCWISKRLCPYDVLLLQRLEEIGLFVWLSSGWMIPTYVCLLVSLNHLTSQFPQTVVVYPAVLKKLLTTSSGSEDTL